MMNDCYIFISIILDIYLSKIEPNFVKFDSSFAESFALIRCY